MVHASACVTEHRIWCGLNLLCLRPIGIALTSIRRRYRPSAKLLYSDRRRIPHSKLAILNSWFVVWGNSRHTHCLTVYKRDDDNPTLRHSSHYLTCHADMTYCDSTNCQYEGVCHAASTEGMYRCVCNFDCNESSRYIKIVILLLITHGWHSAQFYGFFFTYIEYQKVVPIFNWWWKFFFFPFLKWCCWRCFDCVCRSEVCGSDGSLYGSDCLLREAQCLMQTNIEVMPLADCMGKYLHTSISGAWQS